MPQTGLASLLAEIFAAQGWRTTQDAALEGRSGTVYGAPVLVETTDLVMLVERRGREDKVRVGLIEEMARVVEDTGADIGLLAFVGEIEPAARQAAAGRILLWDRTLLTLLVGATRIAHAAGTPLPTLPLEEGPVAPDRIAPPAEPPRAKPDRAWFDDPAPAVRDFTAPWEPAPRAPGPPASADSPVPTRAAPSRIDEVLPPAFQDVDLEALETVGGLDSFFDEPVSDGADAPAGSPADGHAHGVPPALPASAPDAHATPARPAGEDLWSSARTAPAPPQPPVATTHPALPPRIRAEKAAESVQDRLFGVRGEPELVLQPVHLLDYECDLLTEGSLRYDTVAGRVEVHGTTKDVRDVDPIWIDPAKAGPLPNDLQVRVDQRVLRVSDALAQQLAHEALLKAHSRIVQIESADEEDDVIVMERRDVSPRPDQVRVRSRGVVLRPFWRLRGGNGACLVDAITGEVVGEELRTYDPDAMVIE